MVYNKSLPTEASDDEMITCNNCKITTLSSLLKTKLVCHILVNTEDGMRNYTCFNDAIQSFLTKIKNTTPIADIPLNDLNKLLLMYISANITSFKNVIREMHFQNIVNSEITKKRPRVRDTPSLASPPCILDLILNA